MNNKNKILKETNDITHNKPTIIHTSTEEENLFNVIVEAIHEKKGESVIALDLRNIDEAVANFLSDEIKTC